MIIPRQAARFAAGFLAAIAIAWGSVVAFPPPGPAAEWPPGLRFIPATAGQPAPEASDPASRARALREAARGYASGYAGQFAGLHREAARKVRGGELKTLEALRDFLRDGRARIGAGLAAAASKELEAGAGSDGAIDRPEAVANALGWIARGLDEGGVADVR